MEKWREVDEVSRKLDGLSRTLERVAEQLGKPVVAPAQQATNTGMDAIVALSEQYHSERKPSLEESLVIDDFIGWARQRHHA